MTTFSTVSNQEGAFCPLVNTKIPSELPNVVIVFDNAVKYLWMLISVISIKHRLSYSLNWPIAISHILNISFLARDVRSLWKKSGVTSIQNSIRNTIDRLQVHYDFANSMQNNERIMRNHDRDPEWIR